MSEEDKTYAVQWHGKVLCGCSVSMTRSEALALAEEMHDKGCEARISWRFRLDAAPPAPPVATTGAVPREDLENIIGVAVDEANELTHHAAGSTPSKAAKFRDEAHGIFRSVEAVRSWLSADGAVTAEAHSYSTTHSAAPAPKASEGEEPLLSTDGRYVLPDSLRPAQPHARAEGATGGIPVSEALDWPEHRSWCVHHKGERCDCGRNAAEETLRRALSGSAEGQ